MLPCHHSVSLPLWFIQMGYTKIYFGENQLSPGSISILPLTSSHPMLLQQQRVRASPRFSSGFTLLKVSSPGFGFYVQRLTPYSGLLSLRLPPLGGVKLALERRLAGSFFNRHDVSPTLRRTFICLLANGFSFYFTGCLTLLFTFPSRY